MSGSFEGQAVWITGGTSGIGRAMALEFAKQGADVAVSGRRKERLDEVAAEIEALGRRGLGVACDVTDEDQVKAAADEVAERFGKLDVAVANAGFSVSGRVERLSADDWRRQLDTNVVGAAITAKHALPHLRDTRGRVALVASVAGQLAAPGVGAYSASKFALRAIGLTLSQELHGSGVTCTTIHPGFVHSEIAQVDNKGERDPNRKDKRPQRFMWPTDRAARVMVKAIHERRREYTFTGHGKFGAFLGRHAPGLVHFIMTRDFGKKAASNNTKDGA